MNWKPTMRRQGMSVGHQPLSPGAEKPERDSRVSLPENWRRLRLVSDTFITSECGTGATQRLERVFTPFAPPRPRERERERERDRDARRLGVASGSRLSRLGVPSSLSFSQRGLSHSSIQKRPLGRTLKDSTRTLTVRSALSKRPSESERALSAETRDSHHDFSMVVWRRRTSREILARARARSVF